MSNSIKMLPLREEGQEDWDFWDPMQEDYNSSLNTLALYPDASPLCSLMVKPPPIEQKVGDVLICEHFVRFGHCADEEYCDRAHISPKEREIILDMQSTYENSKSKTCLTSNHLSPPDIEPNPKAKLLVSVTAAKSPSNFNLVLPYFGKDLAECSQEELGFYIEHVTKNSSLKMRLQGLHDQLATMFDHPYRVDNVNEEIHASQIVACKMKDGIFRRAMVLEEPELFSDDMEYKLTLIDIGTEISLPREKIYDIIPQHLSEPPMAINCRLDLKPANGEVHWSQDAIEFFNREARSQRFLLGTVNNYLAHDEIYTVELSCLDSNESLSETMIKLKLAERCPF